MGPQTLRARTIFWGLLALPFLVAGLIWLSPLAFVPVPWPDDSAFYFVAHEFFKWPPRWVMLPQAPFEPTYSIYNFNTMPLYPILIGLGRYLGIDGSFALKLWPLGALAGGASLLGVVLFRAGLPSGIALLVSAAFILDPCLRWASVLVRPESLIAFFGVALVLGLTLGFPKRIAARGLWDPAAFLMAAAAYAHFNAIQLVVPVVFAFSSDPIQIIRIGALTALYLVPWALTVVWHFPLFTQQMATQWKRLHFANDWLNSIPRAIDSLFPDMGSPEPWPQFLKIGSILIWLVMLGALAWLFAGSVHALYRWAEEYRAHRQGKAPREPQYSSWDDPFLLPAVGWLVGAIWLWHTKPELWFVAYLHFAAWTFAGVLALQLHRIRAKRGLAVLCGVMGAAVTLFFATDIVQARNLGRSHTWNWDAYRSYVSCIDRRLTQLQNDLGPGKPFRVWAPTFPDVTIELIRRHPDWSLTRTNDFWERKELAKQHGRDVEAVVITETLQWHEREIDAPWQTHPEIRSTWAEWRGYYYNDLYTEKGWKPHRHVCQVGRWTAFIFMN